MSHTVVSDIENCKVCPNLDTLQMLYHAVGLSLQTSPDTINENRTLLKQLFDAIYFQREESVETYYLELKKRSRQFLFSPLRVDFLLAIEAYRTFMSKKSAGRILTDLKDFLDYLSRFQQQTLHTVTGVRLFLSGQYPEALKSLQMAVRHHASEKLDAVAKSYLAYTYDALYLFHRSLHTAQEASKAHGRLTSPIRKIYVDFLTVKSLIDLKKLDEAEKLLQSLSQIVHQPEFKIINTADNFSILGAYLAYVQGDYANSLKYLEDVTQRSALIAFSKAQVAYCLQDVERLQGYVQELDESTSDNADYYKAAGVLLLDAAGIKQPENKMHRAAERMLKGSHDAKNIHLHYFLYELLLDYCNRFEETEKGLAIMKKHFRFCRARDIGVTSF